AQVHDKLKQGLGYNAVEPPFNNNYIPTSKCDPSIPLDKKPDEELLQPEPLFNIFVKATSSGTKVMNGEETKNESVTEKVEIEDLDDHSPEP
ncbi:hypothetical protein, partial [Escherichia coli]|uniref:hypothetical protein n=1 Tax=Escherichia coli TaxID=562 RepID=UPI001411DF80